MYARPDLTANNLIHLTKGEDEIAAFNTLIKILKDGQLKAGDGFIKGKHKCVCFSEAPLSAMATLMAVRKEAEVRYHPMGISISRKHIYKLGGRPVIYQADGEYSSLPEAIRYRHVSYDPTREPKEIDFTWEREWRIKCDAVQFTPAEVTVILPNRNLAEQLRTNYEHAWKKSFIQGNYVPRVFPWHFVVLEDLGVVIDFPKVKITVGPQQAAAGGVAASVTIKAFLDSGAGVDSSIADASQTGSS